MQHPLDKITQEIIAAAIEVHRELGPGLLESAYEDCLAFELAARGLPVERQKRLPLTYKGKPVGVGYRLDLLVGGSVIVEVKSVDRLEAVHTAQVLSYLHLAGCSVALLLNFT
jgi:GxxExxY protein